ncbi:uncharacterized protein MELLADRAFT_85498 [Melampsora larici-populina 98AG31]|uniref:G-protein coupled receptors family 1 profile domain-containing protein n=1 Tax=Melampsora larici-populina (strain 98AG31 / pathotype 3-4-7) TaxID=747676 RepID=F4RIX9_MELLP|nr:uncharacterized protein MELLADRAFT_85498 [Melampsora larici-populina 98AG31]EGG07753.1 hypothetical protein MELLADRAFT_85498 [Melampsora larici-populina 98AG31]
MHSDQTADAVTFGLKHIYMINTVITALSALGGVTMILPFIFIPQWRQKVRHKLILGLGISDISTALSVLIPSIHLLRGGELDRASPLCQADGFFYEATVLTSSFWTVGIAVVTYTLLIRPMSIFAALLARPWTFPILFGLVWLAGCIISGIGIYLNPMEDLEGFCFYGVHGELYGQLSLFLPRVVVSFVTIVLYLRLFFFFRRQDSFAVVSCPRTRLDSVIEQDLPGAHPKSRRGSVQVLIDKARSLSVSTASGRKVSKDSETALVEPIVMTEAPLPQAGPGRENALAATPASGCKDPQTACLEPNTSSILPPQSVPPSCTSSTVGVSIKPDINNPFPLFTLSAPPPFQTTSTSSQSEISSVGLGSQPSNSTNVEDPSTEPAPISNSVFGNYSILAGPTSTVPTQLPFTRQPFVSGPTGPPDIAPEEPVVSPSSEGSATTTPASEDVNQKPPLRPGLCKAQRSWNWFSYTQSNASSALTKEVKETFKPVRVPRAVIIEPLPIERIQRSHPTTLIPFSNNIKRLSGQELNRRASMLMLLYPAAYTVLLSVSLARLVLEMGHMHPNPYVNAISKWLIMSSGWVDAVIFIFIEWTFRQATRNSH